jgi:predicted ATPase
MSETQPANGRRSDAPTVPFLKRVRIRNYKSIAQCDVELGALTVLVGRNGSGKSNFLDALSFVADALRLSLDHAVRSRGGLGEIMRRGTAHHEPLSIDLRLDLGDGSESRYGFEIRHAQKGGIQVTWEHLTTAQRNRAAQFSRRNLDGRFDWVDPTPRVEAHAIPVVFADRLYLVAAAGHTEFRGAFDALSSMVFYNPNPEAMKVFQSPDAGEFLRRDGGNIASVVGRIGSEQPEVMERLKGYLATIVPEIRDVNHVRLGPVESLEFHLAAPGSEPPRTFYPISMSDGTLRVLGVLVAVAQLADGSNPVRLVGIEEPETALHPAASAALMDALKEAAVQTQVVVTTHSPDLLDQIDPETDRLLVVEIRDGDTVIGPISRSGREAVKEQLCSPGELLRMDLLRPDGNDLRRQMSVSEPAGPSE